MLKPLKPIQSFQDRVNQRLFKENLLENGFEATFSSKTNVLNFENDTFQFFANFWVTKLKPFSGKVRLSVENCLSENLIVASFLENGFEATLI